MSQAFHSRWRRELMAFVRFKVALGRPYVRPTATLLSFDRFAASSRWRDCTDWQALTRAWLSQSSNGKAITIANYISALRQFCLFRRRYDPRAFVPDRWWARQTTSHFFPYIFSTEQIQQLIAGTARMNVSSRSRRGYRLLYLVLYCTGLRIGEALRLRTKDVDLRSNCFHVGPSKGRIRWVPFHADLALELRRWLDADCSPDLRQDAFMFAEADGRPFRVKNATHNLRALLRRCGLKPESGRVGPRCHDLRHTMAVHRLQLWYREGRDLNRMLPSLSAYLGHRNLLGTERYLHATPELLAVAAERLQRQLYPRSLFSP